MRFAGEGSAADPSERVPSPSGDETYPRSHRLKRRQDFLRAQREGTRVHTPHFVVIIRPRPEGDGVRRLGITVTKKVAGSVGRNRVKRVVREVFRRNRHLFPESCDIVVIAKSGAPALGYQETVSELSKVSGLLARAARGARRRSSPRPRTGER